MAAKFEIKSSSGGQCMFNLKAGNGEVILTSERYKAKKDCENGIGSVKKIAPTMRASSAKRPPTASSISL